MVAGIGNWQPVDRSGSEKSSHGATVCRFPISAKTLELGTVPIRSTSFSSSQGHVSWYSWAYIYLYMAEPGKGEKLSTCESGQNNKGQWGEFRDPSLQVKSWLQNKFCLQVKSWIYNKSWVRDKFWLQDKISSIFKISSNSSFWIESVSLKWMFSAGMSPGQALAKALPITRDWKEFSVTKSVSLTKNCCSCC